MRETISDKKKELRSHYENNLFAFAKYINPQYMYGDIHEKVFNWLSDPDANPNQLLLLPRGHLKSHCIATYVVWKITRKPWTTMVYLTAGDDLATVQMSAIKGMLASDSYKRLWPEMIKPEESKRTKWATREISVDHPDREKRRIRDYTVIIKTIGASATGLHCDELLLDDIVVPHNAYTKAGRDDVAAAVADFTSVKNTEALTKACGTRYLDTDVYSHFIDAKYFEIDPATGEATIESKLWDTFEAVVEDVGDGSGNFLWPRTKSPDTEEWYGWDARQLAIKKAEYALLGKSAQFYSQYYNDPNEVGEARINQDTFMYITKKHLECVGNTWFYSGKKLELIAGMDVAWSDSTGVGKDATDWSAIAVVAMDNEHLLYVLDLVKFKTSRFHIYYNEIFKLVEKWHFKRLFVETNSAGKLVKQEIDRMIRENGRSLITVGKNRGKRDNSKQERYAIVLEPKYEARTVYHVKGGLVSELEDQIKKSRPKHDDLKDAVTIAFEHAIAPGKRFLGNTAHEKTLDKTASNRFGGRRI